MPRPARAARPAGAPAWPRRGIERPRGTFVGRRAAATACALCCSRTLYVFGLPAARARGLAAGALGVEGVAETSPGCEGLPADTRKSSQTRRCFFRGKGRLGRRGEPWRGREAPREGWGGDASMQPVYLAKANKSKTARKVPLFIALDVGPALPRLPSAALSADCVTPAQESRARAAGTAHWTH